MGAFESKIGWARWGLNPRPKDYESPALTAELQARVFWLSTGYDNHWVGFCESCGPFCHTLRETERNTTKQMTTLRKTNKKTTRLKRSKLKNLIRHANGVYWCRTKVNGKSVERSLRTSDYNLAATMLPETLMELKGAS